ncbi:MAG: M48 family metallopeptidase [Kiritimatiellae bacterium]|nr:M48 family metallopeptidase [Kiritimatiellia bacterium]
MWEMIQSNRRKSAMLIVLLAAVLMFLGYAIGFWWSPEGGGGIFGVVIAMVVWLVMILTSLGAGENILLATAGAREVTKDQAPQLYNIVEEMKIASGLPAMPRVFIMESPAPNAFAVGLKPERAAVAVTTGLLARLNRDELQGVIAHELGHINNRDTLFMTLAGVTVGAVIILADLFVRGMWFGGGRRRGGRDKGGGILILIAIVLAIVSPFLAQMLYFACSRRREYLADASAALYTRYPEGLASALEKISAAAQSAKLETSRALAPMYTINPLAAASRVSGLFSTHPPTQDRIRVLRGMTGDSSLAAYEQAFRGVHKSGLIGARTLQGSTAQATRAAGAEEQKNPRRGWRDAQDLLHKVDQYALLACACGLRLKVPPEFEGKRVKCPRCGAIHDVPHELFAAAAAIGAAGMR